MVVQISIDRGAVAALCRRHHITRLSLFGSVTRDDFGPESDVDVLVEFEPGMTPGFGFFDIQDELAQLLDRPVDLVTREFLSPYIRDRVMGEAISLYSSSR